MFVLPVTLVLCYIIIWNALPSPQPMVCGAKAANYYNQSLGKGGGQVKSSIFLATKVGKAAKLSVTVYLHKKGENSKTDRCATSLTRKRCLLPRFFFRLPLLLCFSLSLLAFSFFKLSPPSPCHLNRKNLSHPHSIIFL
jgi:hypothetical protein